MIRPRCIHLGGRPGAVLCALALAALAQTCWGQNTRVVTDRPGDVALRRPDPGADGRVEPEIHRPPDILYYEIGAWDPNQPDRDLFQGRWRNDGDFVRLDIVFAGLVNPPGRFDPFLPFDFGEHPLFGYVEIDLDADLEVQASTGGELVEPHLRFNGNVARYGGYPVGARFADRVALDATAFDGIMATPPYVDRAGEEFHIAFHGWQIDDIEKRHCTGQCGQFFKRGEIWVLVGPLFHRAHGYEKFTDSCCPPNGYEPVVQIQFEHDIGPDQTTVSLVYPLTNAGSAEMRGDPRVEPNNSNSTDQNSVLEGLDDLRFTAENAEPHERSDPDFPIIAGWEFKDPADHLDPLDWGVTILAATSYHDDREAPWTYFVWSDLSPDVRLGDFDGDGQVDCADCADCRAFIADNDGRPGVDEDQTINGVVDLIDFGPNFSLFDLDYNGLVEGVDCPCNGCGVDLADAADFQFCFTGPGGGPVGPDCDASDFDGDRDVDLDDYERFVADFIGP